jgi:CO/xanthine dehydrogenase FAD-binding subunit
VEQGLTGQSLNDGAIAAAAAQVKADLGDQVSGDIFASAAYRTAVAPVYVKRAIAAAAARAGLA